MDLPRRRWWPRLVPVTAARRQRCPPADASHAGRAVHREHAQAAPPVKEANADDRREDDKTQKIDHRCLLLTICGLIARDSWVGRVLPAPEHRRGGPTCRALPCRAAAVPLTAPSPGCGPRRTTREPRSPWQLSHRVSNVPSAPRRPLCCPTAQHPRWRSSGACFRPCISPSTGGVVPLRMPHPAHR